MGHAEQVDHEADGRHGEAHGEAYDPQSAARRLLGLTSLGLSGARGA